MKLIQLAVSLGGVQSLIEIAAAMTHPEKYISAAERKEAGFKESLIRFRWVLKLSQGRRNIFPSLGVGGGGLTSHLKLGD